MRKVQRADIVDYQTYEDTRAQTRREVMALKEPRRVHAGDYLTFLFENFATVRYQVQEMMRTEKIVRDNDIQREIDTYNELLGDAGELGCALLIEIADESTRDNLLRQWRDLPAHLYLRLADGRRVRPTYDARQIGDEKVSSVQYLKFEVGDSEPIAIGSDQPALVVESELTEIQRAALREDLAG